MPVLVIFIFFFLVAVLAIVCIPANNKVAADSDAYQRELDAKKKREELIKQFNSPEEVEKRKKERKITILLSIGNSNIF